MIHIFWSSAHGVDSYFAQYGESVVKLNQTNTVQAFVHSLRMKHGVDAFDTTKFEYTYKVWSTLLDYGVRVCTR